MTRSRLLLTFLSVLILLTGCVVPPDVARPRVTIMVVGSVADDVQYVAQLELGE